MARLFNRKDQPSRWGEDQEAVEPPPPLVLPEPTNPDFYDPGWDDWGEPNKKGRRIALIALIVLAVATLSGIAFKHQIKALFKGDPVTTTTPKLASKSTLFNIQSAPGATPPTNFTGKDSGTTGPFALGNGLSAVSFTCKCTSALGVRILDDQGDIAAIPVNQSTAGRLLGSVPVVLPAGSYTAQVTGKGSWALSFTTPNNPPTLDVPFRITTGGPELIGPFSGASAVTMSYGAVFPSATPVVLSAVDLKGNKIKDILQTQASGVTSANVEALGQPYYVQAQATLGTWYLSVAPRLQQ